MTGTLQSGNSTAEFPDSGLEALCISLPSGHDSTVPDYNTQPERYRTGFYTVVMHLNHIGSNGTDIKRHTLSNDA